MSGVWRVEARDPAGQGDWATIGRHPTEAEAQGQINDYVLDHPNGEARKWDEDVGPPADPPPPPPPAPPPNDPGLVGWLVQPVVKTVVRTVKKVL